MKEPRRQESTTTRFIPGHRVNGGEFVKDWQLSFDNDGLADLDEARKASLDALPRVRSQIESLGVAGVHVEPLVVTRKVTIVVEDSEPAVVTP